MPNQTPREDRPVDTQSPIDKEDARKAGRSSLRGDAWAVLALARFVLAFIVLTGHVYCLVAGGARWTSDDWTSLGLWWNQGSAVFAFLVISGYSIAASIERSPAGFYARRAVRIFPLYLLSLFLAVIVSSVVGPGFRYPIESSYHPAKLTDVLACLVMLQTFLAPAISADGQIWTLAVEWWLYMIAPVLRKLAMVFVALAAATSFFYLVGLHVGDAATLQHGRAFLGLAWYWLLGFIYYKYRRTLTGYTVLIIPAFFAYFLLTFLGAAFWIGLFAVAFCDRLWVPKWSRAVMKWLGDVSYPLYLLHVPVLILCVHYHITSSVAICTLAVLASIAALHLVDLPIRRRFRPNAGDSQRFGQAALSATKSASPL